MGIIKETYGNFGFTSIETPCVENLANLNCKAGGENEKLIFKILKRGEKLRIDEAKSEEDLTDGGLRYDLTVPLVRYYSNHANELPAPFKALQMGNVWRADRPQRGRYRQFMQCDTTTLGRIGFQNFNIRINDRQILKAMAAYSGFAEADYDQVFIILDKMDKIGTEGVEAELLEAGFAKEKVEKYLALFQGMETAQDPIAYITEKLSGVLPDGVKESFQEIMDSVEAVKGDFFKLVFDPTLVRGMSYYTGTIFEIDMPEFGGSCGGGGRYDKMVGKFTGNDVPACGFSIGFERIILLLLESGFKVPREGKKIAYLMEKGLPSEKLCEVMAKAQEEREKGNQILVARMNKNKKFQKEQLTAQGYEEFCEFYREELKR